MGLTIALVAVQMTVGTVFIVAGAAKIASGQRHVLSTVESFDLVPKQVASLVALVLPGLELATGAFIFTGLLASLALPIAMCLLATFTAAAGFALATGRKPDCGCFGALSGLQTVRRTLFLRNGALLVATGALAVFHGRPGLLNPTTLIAPEQTTSLILAMSVAVITVALYRGQGWHVQLRFPAFMSGK
jgi:hypothetical protein